MTTDTFPKVATATVKLGKAKVTINGMAKGAGMIMPDMATMLAFTKVKGSVPVRRDVSTATLSDYQRAASAALWHDTVLLSMTHGELMNTQFQEALYAAVKDYAKNKNQRAFINTVQRAGNAGPVGGR